MKTISLTLLTLLCFAANSLLCRGALKSGSIDAASFTGIRLLSGAIFLFLFTRFFRGKRIPQKTDFLSVLALSGYAIFFSLSYVQIDAGVGAFLLFGSVQVSMLSWTMLRKDGPNRQQLFGLLIAIIGLALFCLPGKSTPNFLAGFLMLLAGVSWAVYSIRGKSMTDPIEATANNFIASIPFAAVFYFLNYESANVHSQGMILAIISGALTSGLGYTIWYRVLPFLGLTRAAMIQLSVPVLAFLLAIPFLHETPTWMTISAGAITLGGVWLGIARPQTKKSTRTSIHS